MQPVVSVWLSSGGSLEPIARRRGEIDMTRWCALLVIGTTWGCVAGQIGVVPGELGQADDGDVPDTPDEDEPDDVVRPPEEQCGNDLDDDADGEVDENCGCAAGSERPCYGGPAETAGVGACVQGVQRCDDHFEFPEWGACEGAVMPGPEVSANGLDDDCNGAADCEDPSLAEDPFCLGPCPGGTPTYQERDLGPGFGGSGIEPGDGEPIMPMECGEPVCDGLNVSIERPDGTFECVEPPPECEEGTYPTWETPEAGGDAFGGERFEGGEEAGEAHWECEPPCELIVHYGGLFGNKTVCAEDPDIQCPNAGEVPTWVYETEEWECLPMCDNGMYDQIWLDGAVVCVPC